MKMTFDRWHDRTGGYENIDIKNFSMIEDFIIRLDQLEFTEIILESDNGILNIAGGNENYVASIQKLGIHHDLMGEEQLSDRHQIDLMIGGESIPYDSSRIIGVNEVLTAAQSFYENGAFDETLKWKKRIE